MTVRENVAAPTPAPSAWLAWLDQRWVTPVVFWLVSLFLVYPVFFLNLSDINPWDEAAFIHSGRVLVDLGQMPVYSANPLASLVYALTYLPFRSSPYWLVQSAGLARPLLFTLMFFSLYLVARQFTRFGRPVVALGVFLAAPFTTSMLRFPSDPLFAGLAGLAFWQLLRYHGSQNWRHLALASAFLGLSALARNDGLVLLPILVMLAGVVIWPGKGWPARAWLQHLAAAAAPFVLLVGGYLLIYGLATGVYELGTAERTYENFEAGQAIVYTPPGVMNLVYENQVEARRLFGTPEENGYSAFTAIARNPQAYLERARVFLLSVPNRVLHAYRIRLTALYAVFALAGLIELARQKQWKLLVILLLWPAHLASALVITLIRDGHLLFSYYILLSLVAVGISKMLAHWHDRNQRSLWLVTFAVITAASLMTGKLAVFYGASVVLGALLVLEVLRARFGPGEIFWAAGLLVLLAAALVIRGDFPTPVPKVLGDEASELAVAYMWEHYPPDTKIGAASPGPVLAARMTWGEVVGLDIPQINDGAEYVDWLRSAGMTAVYVDHSLYNGNPKLWEMLKPQIGVGLERVFVGDEGDIQILEVRP